MVAPNPAYAPVKTDERPENRVGGFFLLAASRAGSARPASPDCIGEKRGCDYDTASGVTDYGFRYYVPETGRWTSADPAGFPDGPNRHFYAPVPTMGLDPMGLEFVFGGSVPKEQKMLFLMFQDRPMVKMEDRPLTKLREGVIFLCPKLHLVQDLDLKMGFWKSIHLKQIVWFGLWKTQMEKFLADHLFRLNQLSFTRCFMFINGGL